MLYEKTCHRTDYLQIHVNPNYITLTAKGGKYFSKLLRERKQDKNKAQVNRT